MFSYFTRCFTRCFTLSCLVSTAAAHPNLPIRRNSPNLDISTSTIENPSIMNYLDSIEYKDTIAFVPSITGGKVVKVYDGDTITIASKMPYENSPIFRFSVRLLGIDTPEIKSKSTAEKDLAIISRDALSEKIMGKIVQLKNVSLEKYGRLLADVYLDDLNLNQWLLENKYAVAYDGGTKHRPDTWTDEPI